MTNKPKNMHCNCYQSEYETGIGIMPGEIKFCPLHDAAPEMLEILRKIPSDDVDMVIDNPDEGQYFFCCQLGTSVNYGILNHAEGCWYTKAKEIIAKIEKRMETNE